MIESADGSVRETPSRRGSVLRLNSLMPCDPRPPRDGKRKTSPHWPCLVAFLTLAGCTHSWYVAGADREVNRLLDDYDSRVLARRSEWVTCPRERIDEPARTEPQSNISEDGNEAPGDPEPLVLDLAGSLELAFTSSRDFLEQRESLYLQGLGFTLTRYNFGPVLNSTISYLWSNAEDGIASDQQGMALGVSQTLPTGGTVSVSSSLDGARSNDPNFLEPEGRFLYDPSVRINLQQPLLRGAGYEVSHEALTQGERNLIYAVRAFELFRQDYSIRVSNAYYSLVSRKTRLANDEQNYQDAVFDRKKAEALRQVDRNQDDDVFLARRREIEAEDALLVARTDYELALDDFKILLGLPTSTGIRIVDVEPDFEQIRIDAESAVEVALHNRLDLHSARDRLEDAERQARLAGKNLLPDLDLSVALGFDGDTRRISEVSPDHWSASVGLTLDLPLDRKAERNAYRSSLILLDQTRRDLQRRLDEVERDILNQVRELTQTEKRLQLQIDQIEREKRAVAVTRIRYEAGDVDNRALLEARQGLTNAQNALIDLKVRHFIAGLTLRRNMGVLFIDDKGMWQS